MSVTPMRPPGVEPQRALVFNDRKLVVDLIEQSLNHGLFVVRSTRDLAEAESMLAGWRPDLLVIDIDHDDSSTLLRRLADTDRLTGKTTPALALTRRGDLNTRLRAFSLGVDDVVAVPFSPDELRARALVMTRRATGADRPAVPTITIGDTEVDILRRKICAGTSTTSITATEQSLLYFLATRAGRVVARDEILDAIWGADYVPESNLVDRHVRGLRVKLRDDHRNPRFIATVPGEGYRFIPTFSSEGWTDRSSEFPLPKAPARPAAPYPGSPRTGRIAVSMHHAS